MLYGLATLMTQTSELRQSGRALEFFDEASLSRLIGLPPVARTVEFITKECVDNALDKLNTTNVIVGMVKRQEYFELSITDDGRGGFGQLFEDIGNDVNNNSQSKNKLLDFDKSISNKRGLKIVSRGILGYALQSCIGLSRVAWQGQENEPDYTVVIDSEGKRHSIKAVRNHDSIIKEIKTEKSSLPRKFTTIKFILPLSYSNEMTQAHFIVEHLSWVNPQVQFLIIDNESASTIRFGSYGSRVRFGSPDFDSVVSSLFLLQGEKRVPNTLTEARNEGEFSLDVTTRDPLAKWKRGRAGNLHCYSENEFLNLLQEYVQLGWTIFDFIAMFDGFRGKKDALELLQREQIDPKEKLANLTNNSKKKPIQLFAAGKSSSRKPKERELPLLGKKYYAAIFGAKFSKYKAVKGMYSSLEGQSSPWAIELVSLHEDTQPEIYEFVNYTFLGSKDPFSGTVYQLAREESSLSSSERIISLSNLVRQRGQSLLIHGVSPSFRYRDTGKGRLDTSLFNDSLAKAVLSVLRKESQRERGKSQVDILRAILNERVEAVKEQPQQVIQYNRWTQSTVYYLARKIATARGISITRESFTSAIREECKKLGYKRHQLGIVAADRAQLYFRGKWSDVGFEEVKQLAEKGTDILFIEKEGVAEILAPMDKEGIALLNSRGFAVEYAQDLLELSKTKGCNLAVITDMDASGYLMTQNLMQNNLPRVAIKLGTLAELGIAKPAVEEPYKPNPKHYKPLGDTLGEEDPDTYEYIANRRIEIDSVLAIVGPQRFWEYILGELSKLYPTRDYRRALRADAQSIIEERYKHLLKPLIEAVEEKTADSVDAFLEGKSVVSGFLDVAEEERLFKEDIAKKLDSDEELKGVEEAIRDTLKKRLPKAEKSAKS